MYSDSTVVRIYQRLCEVEFSLWIPDRWRPVSYTHLDVYKRQANAVILTEVMRYNAAEVPTKMGTFSQYQYPHALARYAEIGRFVGCQGKDDAEVFENFIAKLEELKEKIGIKKSIHEYGIDEKYFMDTLDDMVEQAFNDQCTAANPRYPLMKEIKELYLKCW